MGAEAAAWQLRSRLATRSSTAPRSSTLARRARSRGGGARCPTSTGRRVPCSSSRHREGSLKRRFRAGGEPGGEQVKDGRGGRDNWSVGEYAVCDGARGTRLCRDAVWVATRRCEG